MVRFFSFWFYTNDAENIIKNFMNLIVDYRKAVHPECGKKIEVHKDIIITPFYTPEFCDELVEMSKFYNKKFSAYIHYVGKDHSRDATDQSPWDTLFFSRISRILFEDFCNHYKKYICPVLEKHFYPQTLTGWFSPTIIKYSRKGQHVTLHNDQSLFTLNVKLNTDYEGCHLEFPRQGWNNKDVPKGWCMVWPSTTTHPHTSHPLVSGTKYSLASWTHPPAWTTDQMGGSIDYNQLPEYKKIL